MKKTIIMLMALAAGAQAAQVTIDNLSGESTEGPLTYSNGTVSPAQGQYLSAIYYYSMTTYDSVTFSGLALTLNPEMLGSAGSEDVVFSATTNNKETVSYTMGELSSYLTESNGALAIIFYGKNASIFNDNGLAAQKDNVVHNINKKIVEYTLNPSLVHAATFYYNPGGNEMYDVLGYDGPDFPGEAVLAQQLISATPKAEGGVTPEEPAVPEPTTATLSLLALSALAARRRRR